MGATVKFWIVEAVNADIAVRLTLRAKAWDLENIRIGQCAPGRGDSRAILMGSQPTLFTGE